MDKSSVLHNLVTGYFLKLVVADNLKDQTFWIQFPFFEHRSTIELVFMLISYSAQILLDTLLMPLALPGSLVIRCWCCTENCSAAGLNAANPRRIANNGSGTCHAISESDLVSPEKYFKIFVTKTSR